MPHSLYWAKTANRSLGCFLIPAGTSALSWDAGWNPPSAGSWMHISFKLRECSSSYATGRNEECHPCHGSFCDSCIPSISQGHQGVNNKEVVERLGFYFIFLIVLAKRKIHLHTVAAPTLKWMSHPFGSETNFKKKESSYISHIMVINRELGSSSRWETAVLRHVVPPGRQKSKH